MMWATVFVLVTSNVYKGQVKGMMEFVSSVDCALQFAIVLCCYACTNMAIKHLVESDGALTGSIAGNLDRVVQTVEKVKVASSEVVDGVTVAPSDDPVLPPTPTPEVTVPPTDDPADPTATPEPTPAPTATPEPTPVPTPSDVLAKIDLSEEGVAGGQGKGTVAYDAEKGALVATEVDKFFVKLPDAVPAGDTIKLRVKGIIDGTGFRTWLCAGNDVATSNQLKSTDDGKIAAGEFTWTYELTATAPSTHIEFKGASWGVNIGSLEITSIELLKNVIEIPGATTLDAENKINVELSPDTYMAQGMTSNLRYNQDGSVSYDVSIENNGGGVIWALNADKSGIPVSELATLSIRIKAEGQAEGLVSTPVVLVLAGEGGSFWGPGFDTAGLGIYGGITSDFATYTYDLSKLTKQNQKLAGVCLKYNTYPWESFEGNTVTVTIDSIEVTRKANVYDDLDAEKDYVIVSEGKTTELTSDDLAQISTMMDTENVYSKWTSNASEIIKRFDSGTEVAAIKGANADERTLVVTKADASEKVYDATIANTEGNVSLQIQERGSSDIYNISLDSDAIRISLDGKEIFKFAKNTDGSYAIAVDKNEAKNRGFALGQR